MRDTSNSANTILTRRNMLRSSMASSLLIPGIAEALAVDDASSLDPKTTHFPAKAKNVIFLFMTGGVSHIDTFDPKPA